MCCAMQSRESTCGFKSPLCFTVLQLLNHVACKPHIGMACSVVCLTHFYKSCLEQESNTGRRVCISWSHRRSQSLPEGQAEALPDIFMMRDFAQ